MFLLRPGVWNDGPAEAPGAGHFSSAGFRVLFPGYVQWRWGQRERAAVLAGSFTTALGVGVCAWGTWFGLVALAFAFGTHVISVLDVVRQSAFPGFGRWMPVFSASGGLAVGLYVPTLVVASLVAWPAFRSGGATEGYLVNCCAYRVAVPRAGDWVWVRSAPWGELHLGRIVAGPGQEVEWSRGRLRVDGGVVETAAPYRSAFPPDELAYHVPEGHVLVDPGAGAFPGPSSRELVLVAQDQIKGRVWARAYPVWERGLLP